VSLTLTLAIKLMKWASKHPKFASPKDYYTSDFVKSTSNNCSPATKREFNDGESFFQHFQEALKVNDLLGKHVLDLGSGYGGRTAYYLKNGNPLSIIGLETGEEKVKTAQYSVNHLCNDSRVSFKVGFGEKLPFSDESFDLILSYDVFEHVQDLNLVLKECYRVLKPGGKVFALFPPYYGPKAHHLDFITNFPFLHYFFSPKILVKAVNYILKEDTKYKMRLLPEPNLSYLNKEVLPFLNGTTVNDFYSISLKLPFKSIEIKPLPFAWKPNGRLKAFVREFCKIMLVLPLPFTKDIFVSTVRCVLWK